MERKMMVNPITRKSWSPYVVGAAIGVLSWFTFATADKPLGITTAFENTAALVAREAVPSYEQTNEYYEVKARDAALNSCGFSLPFFASQVECAVTGTGLLLRNLAEAVNPC
jgi:hypothetical protein